MGRPLFSTTLAPPTPVVRVAEVQTPIYERWSSINQFDPDSDEFFSGEDVVYEAFLTPEEISDQERRAREQEQEQRQEPVVQQVMGTVDLAEVQEQQRIRRERFERLRQMADELAGSDAGEVRVDTPPLLDSYIESIMAQAEETMAAARAARAITPELLTAGADEDSSSEGSSSENAAPTRPRFAATGRLRRHLHLATRRLGSRPAVRLHEDSAEQPTGDVVMLSLEDGTSVAVDPQVPTTPQQTRPHAMSPPSVTPRFLSWAQPSAVEIPITVSPTRSSRMALSHLVATPAPLRVQE